MPFYLYFAFLYVNAHICEIRKVITKQTGSLSTFTNSTLSEIECESIFILLASSLISNNEYICAINKSVVA